MAATAPRSTKALSQLRVAFAGKLGGVSKREAMKLVRENGGIACEQPSVTTNLVVIGDEESPLAKDRLLSDEVIKAETLGQLEVIRETEFWERLGLMDAEHSVRRLYTPAMLAELLGVSVRVIRRWHRSGLIVPVRTVHRLPYFEFQEIATARHLAELLSAGASPKAIEQKLASLSQTLPDVRRPLAQLSVIVEGQQILLRQGEGLIEPSGQRRIDFDSLADEASISTTSAPSVISFLDSLGTTEAENPQSDDDSIDPIQQQAFDCEDAGYYEAAIDCYHAILSRDGARADISFQLAELLYRMGELWAARERYLNAIELDAEFVEARASLGGLLAELGRYDLAVAAFRGALAVHDDYPDVHYNLARTLDEMDSGDDAVTHWKRFLDLAPQSPWAQEARDRLQLAP